MKHRLAVIMPTFFLLYLGCFYTAFLLRCDFAIEPAVMDWFWAAVPVVIGIKFFLCLATGEWRRTFRYAALPDMQWVAIGATLSAGVIYLANLTVLPWYFYAIPRSVIVIDWVFSIALSGLLRMGCRIYQESLRPLFRKQAKNPTLIYGIGQAGIGILRAIQAGKTDFQIVGLIGTGPRKERALIAGIRVYSLRSHWQKLLQKTGAQHILVPGSTSGNELRELTSLCAESGVKIHVIPAVHEILDGRYKLAIRDVEIADLLRREPTQLDMGSIQECITGKRVLVTGAAGSIGSELCRQILCFAPASLVLVDQSEFGIFQIEREFLARKDQRAELHLEIADVANTISMQRIFEEHQPQLVFHAAAYKHVPLMERNPREAVLNNIGGTKTVVDRVIEHEVERFVLISTDKAVCPTSVMGATKLLAEKYVQWASTKTKTQMVTVRFGNVLNSAGSVVPTFRRQIAQGGPVTVTHPEMTRFFMTIPEAVQLVLQAGAVGLSGDVLILEMGEPVKIVDLAKDMIALSGLKYQEDIDIVFTGIRPGEKLYEELFYPEEEGTKKIHDKIFRSSRDLSQLQQVPAEVARLESAARNPQSDVGQLLHQIADSHAAPPAKLRSAA